MGGINKQFSELGGSPVAVRSIAAFQNCALIDEIIVVTREQDVKKLLSYLTEFSKVKAVVYGGVTRQQSVLNGIRACSQQSEFVAVHDGARPLVTQKAIEDTLSTAFSCGAAAVGVKVKDTVKIVDGDNVITSTPDRESLRLVQTPQVFLKKLYLDAVDTVQNSGGFTDDCMLIEAYGHKVKMVEGSYMNIKITTPEDIIIAEALLQNGLE